MDQIVALPNFDGTVDPGGLAAAVVTDIRSDGSWDIEISTAYDWMFLLTALKT